MHLEDVDFTMPTVKVEWNNAVYDDVLLDGGSGVNILSEAEFLKLKKVSLEPALFQVRMADQRRLQPIGMLKSQTIKIHGIQILVNFVVLWMNEEAK